MSTIWIDPEQLGYTLEQIYQAIDSNKEENAYSVHFQPAALAAYKAASEHLMASPRIISEKFKLHKLEIE